jgi:hypothetical protein
MSSSRKFVVFVLMMVALGMMVVPTLAATRSVSVSESDINASFRVTNPALRQVSNLHVDLQPGQAVVSATFTFRKGGSFDAAVTLVPSVSNGRVIWTATAASINGQSVSQELLNQINASVASSWRRYIKDKLPAGRITSVEVTEDAITFTGESR